jgi:hypothetical protein
VQEKAAEGIASIAWFIESKGMLATAEKFSDVFMILSRRWEIQENLMRYAESLLWQL